MADFAAVLKKTLDKMGETTPETRAKVYDKARATVRRQIDAMENTPPQAAIDRQFGKLEIAISRLESEYVRAEAAPEPEPVFEPDDVIEDIIEEQADEVPAVDEAPVAEASDVDEAKAVIEDVVDENAITGELDKTSDEASAIVTDAMDDVADTADNLDPMATLAEKADEAKQLADAKADDLGDKINQIVADVDAEPSLDVAEPDVEMPKAETDALADFLNNEADKAPEAKVDADASLGSSFGSVLDDTKDAALSKSDAVLGEISAGAKDVSDTASGAIGGAAGAIGGALPEKKRGGIFKKLIALLLAAGVFAGGYFAYNNQDQVQSFFSETVQPWWKNLTGGETMDADDAAMAPADDATDENGIPVRTVTTTDIDETAQSAETEAATPTDNDGAQDAPADAGETPAKFTQRLTEDGTEVDEGPAVDANAEIASAEGSTVSEQTAGTANDNTSVEDGAAIEGAGESESESAVAADDAAPLVGQRAIFYEERTGQQEGTAIAGATIWSVSNESPGGDLPVEPAIRAETTVPELGMTMEMTLRRNGDATFPASHIIELFFRVPDNFEGRGIADIQRITFKTNEQDPGNALIAVPAPLDQNIFLIALTDAQTAVATNVQLMQRENWIDIPMQYTSGRRALITFEKGTKGQEVFQQVFDAWEASPLP